MKERKMIVLTEILYICMVIGLPVFVYLCIFIEKEVTLILGSSSFARKQVFDYSCIEYICMSPQIDEESIKHENPEHLVIDIALAKSKALEKQLIGQDCILITADQVVVNKSKIYTKPKDLEEAKKFLKSYSNSKILTITGIVVTNIFTNKTTRAVDVTKIYFDKITDEDIEQMCIPEFQVNIWEKTNNFIFLPQCIPIVKKKVELEKQKVNILDCCGALAFDHPVLFNKVKSIEGSISSILGLPLNLVVNLIEEVK